MVRLINIIKNVIDLKKKTGKGFIELSKLRWDVNLFGEGKCKRMTTWEFADLLYRHGLRYAPDNIED